MRLLGAGKRRLWLKAPLAKLSHCMPSSVYLARAKVGGKFIRLDLAQEMLPLGPSGFLIWRVLTSLEPLERAVDPVDQTILINGAEPMVGGFGVSKGLCLLFLQ